MAIIEKARHFEEIGEKSHKDFLKLVCEHHEKMIDVEHPEYTKFAHALEDEIAVGDTIIDVMEFITEKYKGLGTKDTECYQKWFSVLAVAAYVRSLYFNKEAQYISVMYPRQFTEDYAKEAKMRPDEYIFMLEAIEASLGVNGPIKLKAQADTPGEIFVLAVTLLDNFDEFKGIIEGGC